MSMPPAQHVDLVQLTLKAGHAAIVKRSLGEADQLTLGVS